MLIISGYEGWEMTGKVKTVLLRGQIAIDNGKCLFKKDLVNLLNEVRFLIKYKY